MIFQRICTHDDITKLLGKKIMRTTKQGLVHPPACRCSNTQLQWWWVANLNHIALKRIVVSVVIITPVATTLLDELQLSPLQAQVVVCDPKVDSPTLQPSKNPALQPLQWKWDIGLWFICKYITHIHVFTVTSHLYRSTFQALSPPQKKFRN